MRFHYRRPAAELTVDTDATDEPMSLILSGTKKWLAEQRLDDQQTTYLWAQLDSKTRSTLKAA